VAYGLSFTVLLLVGCLFIGVSEELMFRGIGVTTFRQAGFSEGKVALWTCVLFGLAHATNIFTEGISALTQVLITAAAGYFFYIIRRVSGMLIVSMVMHGLWDFGLFTNTLTTPPGIGVVAFILADVVLAIVAVATIRKVFPDIDTTITEWATAHADLAWPNLTAPTCYLLDWEDWGVAPRGFDAATLRSESLAVPTLADRAYQERRTDLDSRSGQLAQLYHCAKLVSAGERSGSLLAPATVLADQLVTALRA